MHRYWAYENSWNKLSIYLVEHQAFNYTIAHNSITISFMMTT